jgi:nicotinate-nucleotide adenylyltransferase
LFPRTSGERGKRGPAEHLKLPVAAPNMRIGLLGGTFNPAHEGHRHISLVAMRRLGLDRVWWLVSPSNPLKAKVKVPELSDRVAAARTMAHHPRITVTGFEGARGSAYTLDTVRFLKQRYPAVKFVWLMGADNLADFHRWRGWEELFGLVPIAVLDRPGFRLKARASKAAQRFALAGIDESDAGGVALLDPPVWTMLTLPLSGLSSTGLRGKRTATAEKPRGKARKTAKSQKKIAKKGVTAPRDKAAKATKKAAKRAKQDTKKSKKKARRH